MDIHQNVKKNLKTQEQACEAFFKKIAQHKIITLNMNFQTYIIYMLSLFDKHNTEIEKSLKNSGFNPHIISDDE